MALLALDYLVVLVALARYQYRVAPVRHGDRLFYGLGPVGLGRVAAAKHRLARRILLDAGYAGLYLSYYLRRVLVPRVIGGDYGKVRKARGGLPHLRPLRPVAVAPAPEYGDYPAGGYLRERAQRPLKSVPGVRVIDIGRPALRAYDLLQTARNARERLYPVLNGNKARPEREGGGGGGQYVLQVVLPGKPGDELHHAGGGAQTGPDYPAFQRELLRVYVRPLAEAVCN